ncbi:alkaline serine protease [Trichoderma arundinaceum]|uniref:tripeptidyl-peptidase II n=1 Tax=Trichoderma arundinaceum TaxID=490622 RepID=A0A395N9X0_TRIAR|nr:alkaline serine protease [Trichoderma arundinaceum]
MTFLHRSTPGSANYGKHMTSEEVINFFAPAQSSVDAVIDWLTSSGIERQRISQSVNKQWIQFDAAAEEAEDLLLADLYFWEDGAGSHRVIACIRLRQKKNVLKRKLKKREQKVSGLADGPHASNNIAYISAADDIPFVNSTTCSSFIIAHCVRVQYGIVNGTTAAPGNELGIFKDLNDHYSTADLDQFLQNAYPSLEIPAGTYSENRLVDGAIGSWEDLVAGVGPDFGTFLDAIDGSYCSYSAFNETGDCTDPACFDPYYPDTNYPAPIGYQGQLQCGVYKPTNVISISYGAIEDLLPNNYQYRQCNEYLKLGLQGVTVVISSGDSGVASRVGYIGSNEEPTVGTIFTPSLPQTCPYLLTVGDYQKDAVQAYFDTIESSLPFKSYDQIIVNGSFDNIRNVDQVYNHGGRGYPVVAAIGENQLIVYGGDYYTIGGTSLSAPLWASILTLINEKRIASGKSTLGFINPALYAHPEVITEGNNNGCSSPDESALWGFPAATGWDPVTGLGSPNFTALELVLVNL